MAMFMLMQIQLLNYHALDKWRFALDTSFVMKFNLCLIRLLYTTKIIDFRESIQTMTNLSTSHVSSPLESVHF